MRGFGGYGVFGANKGTKEVLGGDSGRCTLSTAGFPVAVDDQFVLLMDVLFRIIGRFSGTGNRCGMWIYFGRLFEQETQAASVAQLGI